MPSRNRVGTFVVGCVALFASGGCRAAQKTMPHMGVGRIDIQAGIEREHLVVTQSVEGSSSERSILGFIKIIDADKYRVFGIPFFKDKYTYFSDQGTGNVLLDALLWPLTFVFGGPGPEDRAYYKALERTPEADIILIKSMDRETSGVPFFYAMKNVTFRGKAMRLKSD